MVTQPKAASSCRRASKPAGAAWRSQRLPPLSSVHVWKHLSLPTPFMSGCAPIAAPRPLELLCQLPISNAPGTQRTKPPLSATQGVRNVGSNCAGPTAPSSAYSSGSHCDASCASAGCSVTDGAARKVATVVRVSKPRRIHRKFSSRAVLGTFCGFDPGEDKLSEIPYI